MSRVFGQSAERPLRVCHAIYRLDYGGMENGLVNLINRLGPQFEHTILTLAGNSEFRDRIKVPVQIVDLGKREGQDWAIYRHALRFLRAQNFDVFHTRNLATLELQLPAAIARVPYRIHGEHGLDVHDIENKNRKYRLMRRVFGLGVHRFVALSGALESYLINDVGISSKRVARICNGVDCDKFNPDGDARERFPSHVRDKFLFGTVGRMQAVKDPMTLVEAFIRLREREAENGVSPSALVMFGDGALHAKALARLAEAGQAEHSWLPGNCPDVDKFLPALDVFILPSLAEGISNAILEAMACGLPVIATAVGGNPELVAVDETGRLVPHADPRAMCEAMWGYRSTPQQAVAEGAAARERALANFSLQTMVQRYDDLYLRI